MTTTNRVANRLVLVLAASLLLAAAAVIALATIPATAERTTATIDEARAWMQDAVERAGSATVHGLGLAVAIVVALLALLVAINRGRGRTALVTDEDPGRLPGSVELTTQFLQDVLRRQLGSRADLLAVDLSAWQEGDRTVLLVRVEPRTGVSPRTVVDAVAGALADLDALLGRRLPVLLRITGGARRTFAAADRVR